MDVKGQEPHPGVAGALAFFAGIVTCALTLLISGREAELVVTGTQFGVVLLIAVGVYWLSCSTWLGAGLTVPWSLFVSAGAAADGFATFLLLTTLTPALLVPAVLCGCVVYGVMLRRLADLDGGEAMLVTALTVISGLPVAWLVALSG